MDTKDLESILSEMGEIKLTEADQLKIKEIFSKYEKNQNVEEPNLEFQHFEEGFEAPDNQWEDPLDFEFLNQDTNDSVVNDSVVNVSVQTEKEVEHTPVAITKVDENGQFQLSLEDQTQMELDLRIEVLPVNEKIIEKIEQDNSIEEQVISEDNLSNNTQNFSSPEINGRKEPILSLEGLEGVEAQATAFMAPIAPENQKFKHFENMAKNSLGKIHNLFNFKDSEGKIDWHNKAQKSVIVLKNVKNAALDNKIVHKLKGMIVEKYSKSKFGVTTNQIADTITVNLMSREERYNHEFKNTMALIGYNVKELITPTNNPLLTLQEVSDNLNTNLKNNLGLEVTNNGYSSELLRDLNDAQKVKFIQTIVWPKLTEMMGESIKLFEALKDIKAKNPLCREMAQFAKKNNMEEELFATMLVKTPELLKQQGIKGLDKLLSKKDEIENVYFKNEELSAKNFIVIQNLVKVSSSMQKNIVELNISPEHKQKILSDMKNTVIKSDSKKRMLFETVQDSVTSSLQDSDFVKSLRDINETILKMRKSQTKEVNSKPQM